jgi:hypothetical protein
MITFIIIVTNFNLGTEFCAMGGHVIKTININTIFVHLFACELLSILSSRLNSADRMDDIQNKIWKGTGWK